MQGFSILVFIGLLNSVGKSLENIVLGVKTLRMELVSGIPSHPIRPRPPTANNAQKDHPPPHPDKGFMIALGNLGDYREDLLLDLLGGLR